MSHVLLESEAYRYFSKALSAEIESIFSDDGAVLAAAFAWTRSFSIFPLFLRFDLGHKCSQLPTLSPKLFCMNLTASSLET
jgi:hypothetical protein